MSEPARYTFRTLIKHLKEHTELPGSFYAGFNSAGRKAEALKAMRDASQLGTVSKRDDPDTRKRKKKKAKKRLKAVAVSPSDDQRIAAAIIDTLAGKSLEDVSSTPAVLSAYVLIDEIESDTVRISLRKQLRGMLSLTLEDEKHVIQEARDSKRDTLEENRTLQDAVDVLVTLFLQTHDVVFTLDRWFTYDEGRHVWSVVDGNTIEAYALATVRLVSRDKLPTKQLDQARAGLVTRLKTKQDGYALFKSLIDDAQLQDAQVPNVHELPMAMTAIFDNMRTVEVASGNVYLYCENQCLRLNTNTRAGLMPETDIRKHVKQCKTVRELLLMACDVEAHAIPGMVELSEPSRDHFITRRRNVQYMSTKAIAKAIRRGALHRMERFLTAITDKLDWKDQRDFIASYLDMLAYCMQPVKRHNCFFYLYGLGENGKSFGTLILERIMPSGSLIRQELEAATNNPRFFSQALEGVDLVVEDDLQAFNNKLMGTLKKFSNGNQIERVERKNSNELHSYLYTASFMMLSNRRVTITDASHGMKRRLHPYHMRSMIGDTFTRHEHGEPLLRDDISLLFNMLRLRIPRVVRDGVYRPPIIAADVDKLTDTLFLQQQIGKLLKRKPGHTVPISDLYNRLRERQIDLFGGEGVVTLTMTGIDFTLFEAGYDVEGGSIQDAKLR